MLVIEHFKGYVLKCTINKINHTLDYESFEHEIAKFHFENSFDVIHIGFVELYKIHQFHYLDSRRFKITYTYTYTYLYIHRHTHTYICLVTGILF